MKKINLITLVLFTINLLNYAYAANRKIVGEVVATRGSVTVLFPGEYKARQAKIKLKLYKDSSVLTGDRSFVRIKFIDGSFLNLGASSKVVLTDYKKKEPGMISLLKGKIRAQIPKKAKDQKTKDDYKFYIKTRNAAIGVRGTDFLTLHNNEAGITSVLTFDGRVAVSSVEDSLLLPSVQKRVLGVLDKRDLNSILNTGNTKIVTRGRFSGVVPAFKNSIIPVKISPKQFELLEKNGNLNFSGVGKIEKYEYEEDPKERKRLRELAKKVKGAKATGYYDEINQEFAPKAGGYLDLNSGIYVQPEPGSEYDKKNNVFIVGKEFGTPDSQHGDYVPPKGLKIDNSKGFILENLTHEKKIELAKEVFGISEEELSGNLKTKIRSSLDQVLSTKKAILNQEVKTDILKTPLDDDEYIYEIAKEFNRIKYMFKEVLDSRLNIGVGYETNIVESFYEELVKNTDKSGSHAKIRGSLAYSSYLTDSWIIKPKLEAEFRYQLSPANQTVKEVSESYIKINVDSIYNHSFFNTPSTLVIGVDVSRINKFEEKHDNYISDYDNEEEKSLYLRDVTLSIAESLRLNELNTLSIGAQFKSYDGFSTKLNGEIFKYDMSYIKRILPRYELIADLGKTQRNAKIEEGSLSSSRYGLGFNILEVANNYNFYTKINFKTIEYDSDSRREISGKEKSTEYVFSMRKVMTELWYLDTQISHLKYKSQVELKNTDSTKIYVGANIIF